MDIFFAFLVFCILCCLYMGFRSEWVYRKLRNLNYHEDGVHIISLYEDYDTIFYRFWDWNIDNFRKKG